LENHALSQNGKIQGITGLDWLGQDDPALLISGYNHGGIIPLGLSLSRQRAGKERKGGGLLVASER